MSRPVLLAAFLVLLLAGLAGCASLPEERGPGSGERQPGRVELPAPEPFPGPAGGKAPPPAWLISGGEVVQASYGQFCDLDVCTDAILFGGRTGDIATVNVPAGEEVFVAVGSDRIGELDAGVKTWNYEGDETTMGPDVFLDPGESSSGLRALEARRKPEREKPIVELPQGRRGGLTVFELASTGRPGDRLLYVSVSIRGPAKGHPRSSTWVGDDWASYRWRLDPGQPGENPPPRKPPKTTVDGDSTTGPTTFSTKGAKELSIRDLKRYRVGISPIRIDAGEGYVWVLDRREARKTAENPSGSAGPAADVVLLRVDPGTGEVLSRTDAPDGSELSVGAGAVWVAAGGPGRVLRVDLESGEVTDEVPTGGSPSEIEATQNGVWVAVSDDARSGRLLRIDPEKGEVVAEIETPGIPGSVAVDEEAGDVWALSLDQTRSSTRYENDRLLRIDPSENEISGSFRVEGGVSDVVASEGLVWVSRADNEVVRIDPGSGEVKSVVSLRPAGDYAIGIGAFSLWTSGAGVLARGLRKRSRPWLAEARRIPHRRHGGR